MASVQAASHAPGGPQIVGGPGLLSLAVAALRFSPWSSAPPLPAPQERIIALDEVSWHDHAGDCWIILYDRVYDITTLLDKHPGGSDVLLEYAGRDATVAFRGTGHSARAVTLLHSGLLGQLPPHECIYRKDGGITLSGMPD